MSQTLIVLSVPICVISEKSVDFPVCHPLSPHQPGLAFLTIAESQSYTVKCTKEAH